MTDEIRWPGLEKRLQGEADAQGGVLIENGVVMTGPWKGSTKEWSVYCGPWSKGVVVMSRRICLPPAKIPVRSRVVRWFRRLFGLCG